MPIFDIPVDRLTDLNDEDLRALVARLCEAERELQGGHRNEVRWGGSQTAADGGLDVVVDPIGPFEPKGPLSRRDVGIQVKAGGLARSEIIKEMRHGGSLRSAISALAAKGGSYLIVSAGVNCSESMLADRQTAMRDALVDDPLGADLHTAFIDRNALARWVSAHPSVAAWLRPRLSLPALAGWQPYGRWSSTPGSEDDTLICEKGLAFHLGRRAPIRDVPEALDAIRALVCEGGRAVRIAGLSGIGKSRIVQALFEPIGTLPALAATQAIYADLGHAPDPAPAAMLQSLMERDLPATLVVDNCPPDTHQALARKVAERPGPVRLITVEYDVRSDRPEETDVVRVEAEDSEIVEALLRRRRPDLSASDARRLAELAQGNARLALALAEAAPQAGTLSAFEDATLFDRLFWQRDAQNVELACAAEVLSLVYSFDVEGEEEPDELAFLGSLAELSRQATHRHARTLLDRGLAQARSRWRAVLPHALANRLARQALRNIFWRDIADAFADKPRLRRSLARRLSYLHESEEARRIVLRWMEAGGPLHGPTPDLHVLEPVCHLAPDQALHAIDDMIAAIEQGDSGFSALDSLTNMIARIAHAENMFPRACDRLVALAIAVENQRAANADNALEGLFGLYLSGTLARTEARVAVARRYLQSTEPSAVARGFTMLRSALKTGHWSSSILFYDDARPDAFGWEPRGQEVVDWYARWIDLGAEIAVHGPDRKSARAAIADGLDGVWRCIPSLRSRLSEIARRLHAEEFWAEGQQALKRMLYYIERRGEGYPEVELDSARRLIDELAPVDLETRLRSEMVKGWDFDLAADEDHSAALERRAQRLEQLGQELAGSPDALRAVGRDLLDSEGFSMYPIGTGLAVGSEAPLDRWSILRDLHLIDPERSRQSCIMSAFLHGLDVSEPSSAAAIRAECRTNSALRREYGLFLPKGVLPKTELDHVIEIAGEPEVSAWLLKDLSWSEERKLADADRVRLLRTILGRPDGGRLVVDALTMLRHVEKGARHCWPEDLRAIGLDAVIRLINRGDFNDNLDRQMADTLSMCLRGDEGTEAGRVLDAITGHAARKYGHIYEVRQTLAVVAESAPTAFLDRAFPDEGKPPFDLHDDLPPTPLSRVPKDSLIDWCAKRPSRWTMLAPHVPLFASTSMVAAARRALLTSADADDGQGGQLSPIAVALLDAAPEPGKLVEVYLKHIEPMSWSGSRADIVQRRLTAIETLRDHSRPEVREVIHRVAPDVRARIEKIRQQEEREDAERDQRFE